jgi:hypothetical protein
MRGRVVTETIEPQLDELVGQYTTAYAYSGENIEYAGRAEIGSAKSAAVWQIKKYVYSGSNLVDILWADGNAEYDNVWNDRASLTYS